MQTNVPQICRFNIIKRYRLSEHAVKRMTKRRFSMDTVRVVLEYGRVVHVRGAEIHAIGKKEIQQNAREGIDLSAYDGAQIVCEPGGEVLTVYRNKNFRGLKPRARRAR